jgi:hypothetical protein
MTNIESTVGEWSGVQVGMHDRGGREFTLANRELGHVHPGRVVDIPFAKRIRDILIEEELAEKHHIYPDSGWVSSYIEGEDSVERALWLLRVSYLYHVIGVQNRDDSKSFTGTDVEQELDELAPNDDLRGVFSDLLERTAA